MIPEFKKKVLSFGEIHGITDTTDVKLAIIGKWLERGLKATLALERGYDQGPLINSWLSTGAPGRELVSCFRNAKTAHYLSDQFSFIQGLADIPVSKRRKLRVLCVDMSFSPQGTGRRARMSRKILGLADEDEFDRERELFISRQFKSHSAVLKASDKVMFVAGNMHASKTCYYFPLREKQFRHIPTVTGWLSGEYGCESVFTLPFSGHNRYQGSGGLKKAPISIKSPLLMKIAAVPFNGLVATKNSGVKTASFLASYDWTFGIKSCTPAGRVRRLPG